MASEFLNPSQALQHTSLQKVICYSLRNVSLNRDDLNPDTYHMLVMLVFANIDELFFGIEDGS
jgi:hypothetical protein